MGLLIQPKDARLVSRDELTMVEPPPPTSSWCPIAHGELLRLVEDRLPSYGLTIQDAAYGLSHEEHRFFGVLQVSGVGTGFNRVIGLRNSTDKRFPAGLCAGISVIVCSNLVFSGTIQIRRKHTVHIRADLPEMIGGALGRLGGEWEQMARRIEAYKGRGLNNREAHHLLVRGMDAGVYSASRIPEILQAWRHPTHLEFAPRNLWSFHNAITENLKDRVQTLPTKTASLNALCDGFIGLN